VQLQPTAVIQHALQMKAIGHIRPASSSSWCSLEHGIFSWGDMISEEQLVRCISKVIHHIFRAHSFALEERAHVGRSEEARFSL
jgi:hypothetical protein